MLPTPSTPLVMLVVLLSGPLLAVAVITLFVCPGLVDLVAATRTALVEVLWLPVLPLPLSSLWQSL